MRKEGNLTFTLSEDIVDALRVKFKEGSTTTPIEVELAGAGESYIGTTLISRLTGQKTTVKPRNMPGSYEMTADGAIAASAKYYGAAGGKISATVNGAALGTTIEAATADGDLIEVLPFPSEGRTAQIQGVTIATTGDTDAYVIAEKTGPVTEIVLSGIDALAANDTNYITWTITNLGQAGAGSTALLAADDTNTTKATGGTALVANSKRVLTLHGTAANLEVAAGDRLKITAAATGTLANTVTGPVYMLQVA